MKCLNPKCGSSCIMTLSDVDGWTSCCTVCGCGRYLTFKTKQEALDYWVPLHAVKGIDTSDFNVGDDLYLSADGLKLETKDD